MSAKVNTANAVVSRQHLANVVEDDALVTVVVVAGGISVPFAATGGHWSATAFGSATSKSHHSTSSLYIGYIWNNNRPNNIIFQFSCLRLCAGGPIIIIIIIIIVLVVVVIIIIIIIIRTNLGRNHGSHKQRRHWISGRAGKARHSNHWWQAPSCSNSQRMSVQIKYYNAVAVRALLTQPLAEDDF